MRLVLTRSIALNARRRGQYPTQLYFDLEKKNRSRT
jgi:hypothetical protein